MYMGLKIMIRNICNELRKNLYIPVYLISSVLVTVVCSLSIGFESSNGIKYTVAEIVLFADKSSIEEELIRLNSHILQFLELLKKDSPIGKKFDFIIQEMNREINTIGSKANSLEITNRVIEIKTEIENIREQIQNIE